VLQPDKINACFEAFAAVVSLLNINRIVKDKVVHGISPIPTVGFTLWGLFNLYYYPYLHQWFSTGASVGLVFVNGTWLYLVWKYRKHN
jgi:hypothetical protein